MRGFQFQFLQTDITLPGAPNFKSEFKKLKPEYEQI